MNLFLFPLSSWSSVHMSPTNELPLFMIQTTLLTAKFGYRKGKDVKHFYVVSDGKKTTTEISCWLFAKNLSLSKFLSQNYVPLVQHISHFLYKSNIGKSEFYIIT